MVAELTGRRAACFGECMLELRTRPDGLLSRSYGGDTLNTAVYLARLGAPVDYVTALGDDDLSAGMIRAWEGEGVGTGHVRRLPGCLPGLYVIETDPDGERRFLYWRDCAPVRRLFDPDHADATAAALAGAGLVYLSGISLSLFTGPARNRLFAALERARAQGARIAFDTNFRPRGWPDLAEARAAYDRMAGLSDVVFAGCEDVAALTGRGDPKDVLSWLDGAGVGEAVVKLARPGCLVRAAGAPVAVPVPQRVAPVDTTAAGDSFAAGYLAARLAGRDPIVAAGEGHRLAGTVIAHPGAIIPREATPV
ncbi:sugar kinase [Methylobacterium persicinum]|uniref:2-dehydro-3-deoxygluconokinase n=1 Tax=Methylobacterium persicinum TaxID=374426 RepID=A0ABU0HGI3_9HYPH|nr:sugar kinase [Methylobacterium persicinum]MDQ0441422.1 2-dehydro-3-deoxygluconokinase [Methylobacterium persicinum]GJE39187.1 2-dehydro-3-deoxygluconokinase [Methylobacterium persicinum]